MIIDDTDIDIDRGTGYTIDIDIGYNIDIDVFDTYPFLVSILSRFFEMFSMCWAQNH